MKKLESTFKNMALSLTSITLVAAAALGFVYLFTQAQIDQQKREAQSKASIEVLAGQEGQAIEVSTNGFGGTMRVMVGLAADGTILGYKILEHSETPGLGDKAGAWFQNAEKPNQNIIGRKAGNLKVSKDGGEVDAITAATISSRAFLGAINMAAKELKGVDAQTSASQMTNNQEQKEADNE